MTVEILNAVIHGVKKENNTNTASSKYKPGCFNTADPLLVKFTDDLLKAYSEEANTWADIKPANANIFHQQLINWFKVEDENSIDFYQFSKNVVDEIVSEIQQKYKATGGYVLLINYKVNSTIYLLIVMLKLETRFGIDEQDLSFFETESFTMKNFHEAVRMNLDTWLARSNGLGVDADGEPERCFAFVKKRGVDEDITKYFRLALGCENFAESTANTSALIRALDAYVDSKSFSTDQLKMEFREQKKDILHNYLSGKIKDKQPVSLRAVTALISPTDEQVTENEFLAFIQSNDQFQIDETFNPHKGKVKELERVSGKIVGGSVNFPITEIEHSVFYNSETRELKITGIPDDLHKKILNAKGT
ncbi:nucleoid-associated protein [Acinetobacter pittii]|jgi:nucleoid-associated protein|uniref:nucleoid-associated protein n=1 Tax=Acinetobacter pittii TaxID=48296 RepID=UPI0024DE8AF2|nr:nucleoid-associated protein [Acinetobacter pittii]